MPIAGAAVAVDEREPTGILALSVVFLGSARTDEWQAKLCVAVNRKWPKCSSNLCFWVPLQQ